MKDDFVHTVIHDILREHKVFATWEDLNLKGVDGKIKLEYKGHIQEFYVEIKKELREQQLPNTIKLKEKYGPVMVIAERLFPKIREFLVEQEIAYIEMNGNVFLETENILIRVGGNQQLHTIPEKQGRAFTKAGLKTLFLFLSNRNDINDTYREIAKNAGIALGGVKLILEGLIEEDFALRINQKELKLRNKEELFQKWIVAYTDRLKPALKVGNFRFSNKNDFLEWKKIVLNNHQTQWGGEPAGNIYTKHLQPGYLTIYTTEKKAELIKNYQLIPDPDGNVLVYGKFWEDLEPNKNVVPPLIAYADLLATGKKRCIETAQKIYDQFIQNTF